MVVTGILFVGVTAVVKMNGTEPRVRLELNIQE